jgi:hypothetical protein
MHYIPSKSGLAFHSSDDQVRKIIGPYGSGKSTSCIFEIVYRACAMPIWNMGRRKSRALIIRNTSGELYSTTLQTWLAWFSNLGNIESRQKPYLNYFHTFNDGHGVVELELMFLALDREDDLRKLRSLEATFAYVNESHEVPEGAITHLKGRVGRYPSVAQCPDKYWSGIISDTNPPDTDHWIYRDFELKNTEGYKLIKQPSGLLLDENGNLVRCDSGRYIDNPDADNINNLRKNYYSDMANGSSEEFIKVFCCGKYGSVMDGKPVYPDYNDDIHAKFNIDAIKGLRLHLGFDFGLTPACIIVQLLPSGQFRVLREIVSKEMGIERFIEAALIPILSEYYEGYEIGVVCGDPAGNARKDTDEKTCINVLRTYGFHARGASTNSPVKRISSVQYFLNRLSCGEPAFILSKENCPVSRKGFMGGYNYKRVSVGGAERFRDVPDKNHTYSDIHDAIQYIAMALIENNNIDNDKISETIRAISTQPFNL